VGEREGEREGEMEGERGRLLSRSPLDLFTLSLIPLPSKGEGKST